MKNTILSLEDLFKLSSFCIPQYQRAYAWETEKHISVFLADLREQVNAWKKNKDKTYFLGTLLLHDVGDGRVHVVDGQQRLTTAVIFISAALRRHCQSPIFNGGRVNAKELAEYFVYSKIQNKQKFLTIAEDNTFFWAKILGLSNAKITEESPSSRRLQEALDYFLSNIEKEEWEDLVHTLTTAQVMIYSVSNPADATLIFELQNDRGKPLTDLEALKSYLMHLVYLHAKKPDDSLREIQTQFSKIYRHVESLSGIKKSPEEDAVLSYHCAAYLGWTSEEWRHPKELIKKTVKTKPDIEITQWVLSFVSELNETYKAMVQLLSSLDDYAALAELFVLDRMGTFWPALIKAYALDSSEKKEQFQLACRLMEVYAMRGYGISNLRSDAGQTRIYIKARDFNGKFEDLFSFLYFMSFEYGIAERFNDGLDRAFFYRTNRKDAQYMLWRYENHLRSQTGKQVGHLPWRQYLFPQNDASRLSIEHIAAQNNPISLSEVEWVENEPKPFLEIALHRLGNLVLDSKSANSLKGKYDFTDKLESLSKNSTFLSQGELVDWAIKNQDGVYEWTVESIKKRHAHLKEFIQKTWNPDSYFSPSPNERVEEEEVAGNIESE